MYNVHGSVQSSCKSAFSVKSVAKYGTNLMQCRMQVQPLMSAHETPHECEWNFS